MLRNLSSALLLLVLIGCSPEKPEGPAHWVISDEDTTLTIFGTVHLLKPETKWDKARFEALVKASDGLILELDQSQTNPEVMTPLVMQYGMYPMGDSLDKHIPVEGMEKVTAWAGEKGIPMIAMKQMRPWLVELTISVTELQSKGLDPEVGVEKVFEVAATAAGVPITGLESAEDQIKIFATLSDERQAIMLSDSFDDIADMEAEMDKMTNTWATGDIEALAALMNEDMLDDPDFAEAILYARNRNWIANIESLMDSKEGSYFMAVGAGHLAGDKSVIDLLEQAGWTVTRQ